MNDNFAEVLQRLADNARRRNAPEPLYRCGGGCRDTGWVLVDETGRCTYRRCEVCVELGPVGKPQRKTRGGFE